MKPFDIFTSLPSPLPLKDVDTDMIIPAEFLKSTSKTGYGINLFSRLRENPKFYLNNEIYRRSEILVTGENFGCGSSREHAVWALQEFGYKAIIAQSFADIFTANAGKNGLLLISLKINQVLEILQKASNPSYLLTIDLCKQNITSSFGEVYNFEIEPFIKERLLQGIDEFDYLLSKRHEANNHFINATIQKFQLLTIKQTTI